MGDLMATEFLEEAGTYTIRWQENILYEMTVEAGTEESAWNHVETIMNKKIEREDGAQYGWVSDIRTVNFEEPYERTN